MIAALTPGQPQVDESGGGNGNFHSNARVPDGGTLRDTSSYVQQKPTPGASNIGTVPAVVYINEVDADTNGSDTEEFVELFGPPNAPLNGLVVVLFNGSDDQSYKAFDLDGFALDGNGFFVLGNAAVPGVDLVVGSNTIQNGPDAIALYIGDASEFPNDTPLTTSGLLDAVVYDTGDPDDPVLIAALTPGQPQVDEHGGGDGAFHSNSRVPDGGTHFDTSSYVQQAPTPGASNGGAPRYATWAAATIPAGLDTAFGGDANGDGVANGLVYIFGSESVPLMGGGVLTRPPGTVPFDVDLILETCTDLVHWSVILKYSAGVLALIDPSVTLTPSTITHASADPARFYRYRVGLIP